MFKPSSTYRIQFHKGFTFENFKSIIPYLQKLGITTIYASPIQEAVPVSNHGYDGVNPYCINPEIGTVEQLRELSKELREKGISWLQDIVPNHMAYHQNNRWLMDVLEHGKESGYASYFDILWDSNVYDGKLMVPFLGLPLDEVIEKEELKVEYINDKLVFNYYGSIFPINLQSYISVLNIDREQLSDQHTIGRINSDKELLSKLANSQHYQLCFWQETDYQINFRRFFTVNGLICLNIQDKEVFEDYHKLVKQLLEEGIVNGLRIDHIDGLYAPTEYLEQLRELTGKDAYIVVEKILEPGEHLPSQWPIQGNTGYDFLALVNNLLINSNCKDKFDEFYKKLVDDDTSIHKQIREKKAYILYQYMGGELENLFGLFVKSELVSEETLESVKPEILKNAIGEVLIQCPVYRYYGNTFPLKKTEKDDLQDIFDRIRKSREELTEGIKLLEQVLIHSAGDTTYNSKALHFYKRLMQFAGPLMAKGVEDTFLYTYNRYIGSNEVGDSPVTFGISAEDFHKEMNKRQQRWPLSINATATHDTKRGEDVSARLNVLTDIPDEWIKVVKEWQKMNKSLKTDDAPDSNDEYFIYQSLVGMYLMPGQPEDNFAERFEQYLTKALREAKRHSNWAKPDAAYEEATKKFAIALLDQQKPFWKSFHKFYKKVADFGIINSLSKTILKYTCPGVPDVYQGCELWDLSMVDPDNRRLVDYEHRKKLLDELTYPDIVNEDLIIQLWENRYNGQIKLWLINKLLLEHKQYPELFTEGVYIPLEVRGKYKENILAFARRYKQYWYVIAIPLKLAELSQKPKKDITAIDWKDTHIILPKEAPEQWENLLENTKGKNPGKIAVKDIFKVIPFALLKLHYPVTTRSAGVLMHITSLPSSYGIGDFGKNAYNFADFLARSRQKYWQLLPLNPIESGMGYSPYSSVSSMAGNTLLLSPELMVKDGLLEKDELKEYHLPVTDTVDFTEAERIKSILFEKAFRNFKKGSFKQLYLEFKQFCKEEYHWLDDFALYAGLKQNFKKGWFDWPEEYKQRDSKALRSFLIEQKDELDKIKWFQFMFIRQWTELKRYCNNLGVQVFGDVPFYVSYDSADVWANPDIFSLDENGIMIGVAGVPPDYFNSNGQLWGMPVYRWDVLKQKNYKWWIQRLQKNLQLFDVVRLDHFRAFNDYWEVPAGEKTAINGKWIKGPGSDFFMILKRELGKLPFVAEDLGDINEGVHNLRDEFELPGMKVLQFAFGDDMPGSIYIPHNYTTNYIAYTGTHDNNTTRGWYRQNTGEAERKNLERYTGAKPKEKSIHLELMRMAYASVAKTVIVPMQDVLGLDEYARMNMPASVEKNWIWRMTPDQLTEKAEERLREWVKLYNR